MNILDELFADHRRLHNLLALLERELAAYDKGDEADLTLMRDIGTYYAAYFNRVHHPLEECLFERLLRREPQQNTDTHNANDQHHNLRLATDRLLAALSQAHNGVGAGRTELATAGRQLLQQNRAHIKHEESQPFKRAKNRLTACDWQLINSAADTVRARVDLNHWRRQYDALLTNLNRVQNDGDRAGSAIRYG